MVVAAMVLVAGCSSSGSDATSDTAAEQDTTTTSAEPEGLDLARLTGRIAAVGFGCGIGEQVAICIIDPDGSDPVTVSTPETAQGEVIHLLNWSPDGSRLAFYGGNPWSVAADGTQLTRFDNWRDTPTQDRSPDGTTIVRVRAYETGVWTTPTSATDDDPQWRLLINHPDVGLSSLPDYSPRGDTIVYTPYGDDVCGWVEVADAVTGEYVALTGPDSPNATADICTDPGTAAWSPDGSRILFLHLSEDLNTSRIMVMNSDGTGLRPLVSRDDLLPPGALAQAAAWSPDGRAVALTAVHDMGMDLFIVSADGTEVIKVPGAPIGAKTANMLAWSPS